MLNLLIKLILLCLIPIRWGFIIIIFITIFGFARPYLANADSYTYLRPITHIDRVINDKVKATIPTRVQNYDLSRLFTVLGILILLSILHSIDVKLKRFDQKIQMLREYERIRAQYKSPEHMEKITALKTKLDESLLVSGKKRHELLRDFANIKKELEKIGRDLAFLSIDVVGSTTMKDNEEAQTIESDFNEYHDFVEAKCKEHGLVKASWNPDGLMACFNTVEEAVLTAQDILKDLPYFNRHVKLMKTDFSVRCGISAGHVFYDESLPLEQLSDRVVDIAGHMQKNATPNTIMIAKQMIEPVKSRENFVATKKIVDGLEVSEWVDNPAHRAQKE